MRNFLAIFMMAFLLCANVYAAELAPQGPFRAFDSNGAPCTGCKLNTYSAGTSTPKATYTDQSGGVANTNPVVLDSDGYAHVWMGEGSYKFILTDPNDITIWTLDNLSGELSASFGDKVTTISANAPVTSAYDNYLIITSSSPTLSLDAAATLGEGFTFAVLNSDSGTTVIDPNLSETINGASTLSLVNGEWAIVISDGTGWRALVYQDLLAGDKTLAGDLTFSGDNSHTGKVFFPDESELTIDAGEITVTGVNHTVDTESDAASDDVDTINGGADGQILILSPENDARTVVLKHGTGNIATPDGADITLDDSDKSVILRYDAVKSEWVVLSSPINAATTDVAGIVEKATAAENQAGTANKFPDAEGVKALSAPIATGTIAEDATTAAITGFEAGFNYRIEINFELKATTSIIELEVTDDTGSSWETGAAAYSWVHDYLGTGAGDYEDNSLVPATTYTWKTAEPFKLVIDLYDPMEASDTHIWSTFSGVNTSPSVVRSIMQGVYKGANSVDGIRLVTGAAMQGGSWKLYRSPA